MNLKYNFTKILSGLLIAATLLTGTVPVYAGSSQKAITDTISENGHPFNSDYNVPKTLKAFRKIFKKNRKISYNRRFFWRYIDFAGAIPSGTHYKVKKTKKYTAYTVKGKFSYTRPKDEDEPGGKYIMNGKLTFYVYKNGSQKLVYNCKDTSVGKKKTYGSGHKCVITMDKKNRWSLTETYYNVIKGVTSGIRLHSKGIGNKVTTKET